MAVDRKVVARGVGLSKEYPMGEVTVQALIDCDVEFYEGEFLALLGPSGSGKSTLMNIIGAMDTPTAGDVYFRDEKITGAHEKDLAKFRRNKVGFVFQFYNLIPNLTARENVELSVDLADDPMDIDRVLEDVGLAGRDDHFPSQMSGGEQQRVAIARAIAKNPEILLCDEPTGALDYSTGKLILELLDHVNREMGKTVAIITHNAAIGKMVDRVIRMRSGRIHEITENEKRVTAHDLEW